MPSTYLVSDSHVRRFGVRPYSETVSSVPYAYFSDSSLDVMTNTTLGSPVSVQFSWR